MVSVDSSKTLGNDDNSRYNLKIGTVVKDRYTVVKIAGAGGMGIVYVVKDIKFPGHRICAMKETMERRSDSDLYNENEFNEYSKDSITNKVIRNSLKREAEILAQLDHNSIPKVFDFFDENNRSYLVMELVQGKSLKTILDDLYANEGKKGLDENQVIKWLFRIAHTLKYLHESNPMIIYRDLKPDHIIVKDDGTIKLIDFGIARFESGENVTRWGTPTYAPPELYDGICDQRTDIYSLGIVGYELLTYEKPEVNAKRDTSILQHIDTVSPEMAHIIAKCVKPVRQERYSSVNDIIHDLKELNWVKYNIRENAGQATYLPGLTQSGVMNSHSQISAIWKSALKDCDYASGIVARDFLFICADNAINKLRLKDGSVAAKFPLKQKIVAKPVSYENFLLFVTYDGNVFCVDIELKKIFWSIALNEKVTSSPVIIGWHMFVATTSGNVYKIDAKTKKSSKIFSTRGPVYGDLTQAENLIVFGSRDNNIYAIEQDGELRWNRMTGDWVDSAPEVYQNIVVVGGDDQYIWGLHMNDGSMKWKYRMTDSINTAVAVDTTGTIYAASYGKEIIGIHVQSNAPKWFKKTVSPVISDIVLRNGHIYFGCTNGEFCCLNAATGSVKWIFEAKSPALARPVFYNDTIVISVLHGSVYALPAES